MSIIDAKSLGKSLKIVLGSSICDLALSRIRAFSFEVTHLWILCQLDFGMSSVAVLFWVCRMFSAMSKVMALGAIKRFGRLRENTPLPPGKLQSSRAAIGEAIRQRRGIFSMLISCSCAQLLLLLCLYG